MTPPVAAGTIRPMKPRATAPEPWAIDLESTVRDHLYGERRTTRATPVRRGTPTAGGGRYRLLDRLGSGGTSDVYRARDERLRRTVAVKVIAEWLAHDAPAVRSFRREAELCARLAHRNVPAVLDAGSRPREYIVMELVDGQDTATLLKEGDPFSTSDAVDVLVQVCDALEHAHARGVVHGDVAPRNIMIRRSDGAVRLIDFGAAADRLADTPDRQIMGTPGYVAPEITGSRGPSPESDLYSLGVVAYRLLGGPLPIRGGAAGGTATRPIAVAGVPPLAEVKPDVPAALGAIVASATARNPAARPASMAELRDRLLATRIGATQLHAA
jgi:eukaryotic-like serine/threonine-protein kinase